MNKKILLISCLTLIVDQISKAIVDIRMQVGQSIPVIKNFFYITYYQNSGAAWGIFNNNNTLIIILSFIILLIIYRYMYSFKTNTRNVIAFGLLFGGIIGNLCDRLLFEHVKDFLDFYIGSYNFPIFNFSDMAIVIGIFLLIIAILKKEEVNERDKSRKRSEKNR